MKRFVMDIVVESFIASTRRFVAKSGFPQTNASSEISEQIVSIYPALIQSPLIFLNLKNVSYGSGSFFNGTEFSCTVSLGGSFVVQQSIGVANVFKGSEGVDGIIGYRDPPFLHIANFVASNRQMLQSGAG